MGNRYITPAGALLLACCAVAGSAFAQQAPDYPARPIRLIIPYSPGGPVDIVSRMYASWLERRLKQPVIADNRPGGNTLIGLQAAKAAAPDGYTLVANTNQVAIRPHFSKSFTFNWTTDLTPIGLVAGSGYFLVTHPSVPAKTLAEFIAHAKANPGKLNDGMVGSPVIKIQDLWAKTGVQMTRIPYKGAAPASAALVAGEVQMYTSDLLQVTSLGPKLTVLAYTERRRHPAQPQVPTVAETVLSDFEARFWVGMFGPAGLPAEIVNRLNAEIAEFTRAPESVERFRGLGYQVYATTPEAMRAELVQTGQEAAEMSKRLNIQID